jgi:hypothetical protein
LSSFTCRSFNGMPAQRCQKRAFSSTASSVWSVRWQRCVEHGVVILALTLDLCRQAVEALRTAVGARQKK